MQPWDHWYHCTSHTYGSWLRGDPQPLVALAREAVGAGAVDQALSAHAARVR